MPRLNNKEYTVEELERLIYLVNEVMIVGIRNAEDAINVAGEIKDLVKGSKFTNFEEGEQKPNPIPWNFKFEMLINPETIETANTIRNAMRSLEVNENIKKRFSTIVREETNWYIDRVKYFTVKGDTNILE